MLKIAAEILHDGGYSVIEAASPAEALDALRQEPTVELLFTDVRDAGHECGSSWRAAPRRCGPICACSIPAASCATSRALALAGIGCS
ncbi:MAG: hypothetical protein WDO24_29265 [Pseudomonadota bacterium]